MIQKLAENLLGNDYFVGDIHGQFDLLMTQLAEVHFDFTQDRLISVGDLVDRGEQNYEVVNLIGQPWFYAVRGNHDQMIIDQFEPNRVLLFGDYAHKSPQAVHGELEGQWFLKLTSQEQRWYYQQLKQLPFVIEVTTAGGLIGVNHAGVPPQFDDWLAFTADLSIRNTQELCLRSRQPPKLWDRKLTGIHQTVHGHTTFTEPFRVHNAIWIDTLGLTNRLVLMPAHELNQY